MSSTALKLTLTPLTESTCHPIIELTSRIMTWRAKRYPVTYDVASKALFPVWPYQQAALGGHGGGVQQQREGHERRRLRHDGRYPGAHTVRLDVSIFCGIRWVALVTETVGVCLV